MGLTEFLGRQKKWKLVAVGILLLVAVVLLDIASGPPFESSLFYLFPVSFLSWFLGKRSGFFIAFLSALIAFFIHRSHFYADVAIVYWNALVWLGVYVSFVLIISELQTLYKRERTWSHTDILTGIPNRRAFFNSLEVETSRARRYDHPLTLAYIDLDHFKQVNDRFGHHTGDKLLSVVAGIMKHGVRQADVVARLGGDEFAVLLPETDRFSAAAALEKVRSLLDAAMAERNWPVTFSIGAVTFQPPPESVQEMISAADQAMYTAKKTGGGRLLIRRAA